MILIINNSSDFSFALVDSGGSLISTGNTPIFNLTDLEPDEFLAGDNSDVVPLQLENYGEAFIVIFPGEYDFSSGYDVNQSIGTFEFNNFGGLMQFEDTTGDDMFDTANITVDSEQIISVIEGPPEGEEEFQVPTYDEYIGSWNADVNQANSYAQLFNYYSNPEEVDGVMLYGAMVLAHYFSPEMLEDFYTDLLLAEEALAAAAEGDGDWWGQPLHENHEDLKQALQDALSSMSGPEIPEWTIEDYNAQWLAPEGVSFDDPTSELWWLHYTATDASGMGLEALITNVNPGQEWINVAHNAMYVFASNHSGPDLNENHEELFAALSEFVSEGEGESGAPPQLTQEEYDARWSTSTEATDNYFYQAFSMIENPGLNTIPIENLYGMKFQLMDTAERVDTEGFSLAASIIDGSPRHFDLLEATSGAIQAIENPPSEPVIYGLDLDDPTASISLDSFSSGTETFSVEITGTGDSISLELIDSWGDGWNGGSITVTDPNTGVPLLEDHPGPGAELGGGEGVIVLVEIAEIAPADGIRTIVLDVNTGGFPSELKVVISPVPPAAPTWTGLESLAFANAYDLGFYSGTDHNSMAFPGTQFITRPGQEINIVNVDGVSALDADNNTPYTISSVKLKLLGHSSSFDDVFDLSLSSSQVWNGSPDWADAIFNTYAEPYRQVWVEYTATDPTTGYEHVHTQQVGFICMDGPSVNDIDLHMEYVSAKFSIYHFGIDLGNIGSTYSGTLGITDPETSETPPSQAHWGSVTYPDSFNPAQDRVIFLAKDIASSYSSVPVNPDLLTINIIPDTDAHSWNEKIESVTYLPLDSSAQDYSRFTNGYLLIKPQPGSFQEIAQYVYGPDVAGNAAQQITFQYNAGADSGAGRLISLNIDADYDSDGYHNNRDRFEQDGSIAEPFPSPNLWGYLGNWDNSAGQYDYDMSFHYEGAPAAQYPGEVQYHNLYNRWLGGQEEIPSGNGFYTSRPWTSVGMEGQYVKYFFDRVDGIDFPETFDVSRLNVVLSGDSFELVPYADADNALFKVGTTSFPVSDGAYEGSNRHWVQFKARCLEVGSGSQVSLLHITYEMENGTILVDSQALYSLIPEGATNFNNPSQVISHENGDSSFSWILNAIDPSIIPAGVSTWVQPPVEDDPPADDNPPEDNTPPDNAPVPLFNIDLLDWDTNGYGGTPTVLGSDISISSAGDLLVAVDLQLGFSEIGRADIIEYISGALADTGSLPTQGELEAVIRAMIDTVINDGYNLDLWFGLGETTDELAAYSGDLTAYNDALVRYGQSDGFSAQPPPQSIWPNGAQFINIDELVLDNYYNWFITDWSNNPGPETLGSLDFSGKIVLPTLTYEIDPESNTPLNDDPNDPHPGGVIRFVAAQVNNNVYGIITDAVTESYSENNPQYAAVDVQSVSFPLSNNNNEDNDPQQGENNMSIFINHTITDAENQIHSLSINKSSELAGLNLQSVKFDWVAAEGVSYSPAEITIPGLAEAITAAVVGSDVTFTIDMNESDFDLSINGVSAGTHSLPAWTVDNALPIGFIIDLIDDQGSEAYTQTFADQGDPADQSTLDVGNLEDPCDFPRGPMARQLRYHKLLDESAVDFVIDESGARVAGDSDFAAALGAQYLLEIDESDTTLAGLQPVVSIQTELQSQSDRMLELERMLHGGVDLGKSADGPVFDNRASMKLMAEELKSDQDSIQVLLRSVDGAEAFSSFHMVKLIASEIDPMDPTSLGSYDAEGAFTASGDASDFNYKRGLLQPYGSGLDDVMDVSSTSYDLLMTVFNTLKAGVTVKREENEGGEMVDVALAQSHFSGDMDVEDAFRILDAGIFSGDAVLAEDISNIRDILGDSVVDGTISFTNLNQHRVEDELLGSGDIPVIPDLLDGNWNFDGDSDTQAAALSALFQSLTGYDPDRHDGDESTVAMTEGEFGELSSAADQRAHLVSCQAIAMETDALRRNAEGESDFFIPIVTAGTSLGDSASHTVESAIRALDIDHNVTKQGADEIATELGITLGSRDERGVWTSGLGLVFDSVTGGGFLTTAETVVAAADALNAEAQAASDERDNVALQIGSALSDANLNGQLPNSYTTIIGAINGEYTWRTEGINYKPSVANVSALDDAIIDDATREKGDTYWVEGEKTRYTIAGFSSGGMTSGDSAYDREIAIAEGQDQAAVAAIPAADNPAVVGEKTWADAVADGNLTGDQLGDYLQGEGTDQSDVVVEGALQPEVIASAADTVFVSITQSVDMAKSDQQDMLDQLALEHYDMGVGGMRVLMHEPTGVVSSGALEDLLRSTGAYSSSGMGLGSVGYGEVLLNGLTVGWLMKIEGYTATEVVDTENPLNKFVPCSTIPVVFPHDQIVVKYSKDMDRDKEALLIAAEAGE